MWECQRVIRDKKKGRTNELLKQGEVEGYRQINKEEGIVERRITKNGEL